MSERGAGLAPLSPLQPAAASQAGFWEPLVRNLPTSLPKARPRHGAGGSAGAGARLCHSCLLSAGASRPGD